MKGKIYDFTKDSISSVKASDGKEYIFIFVKDWKKKKNRA